MSRRSVGKVGDIGCIESQLSKSQRSLTSRYKAICGTDADVVRILLFTWNRTQDFRSYILTRNPFYQSIKVSKEYLTDLNSIALRPTCRYISNKEYDRQRERGASTAYLTLRWRSEDRSLIRYGQEIRALAYLTTYGIQEAKYIYDETTQAPDLRLTSILNLPASISVLAQPRKGKNDTSLLEN